MAINIDIIKDKIGRGCFFTGNREMIEFLIGQNLDPLEEYAFIITENKAIIITPHEVVNEAIISLNYLGYSTVIYQNKLQNIMAQLENLDIPNEVNLCFDQELIAYMNLFIDRRHMVNNCTRWFQEFMLTKTQIQFERIKKCVSLNENAYQSISKNFKQGMNELDVFKVIKESYVRDSNENLPFLCDIVSGERSCEVSGFPTDYILNQGDTMIIDLLPRYQGIYCDHTRTFFIGEPTEKQRYVYETLQRALQKAESLLRPGTKSLEIYQAVYETFQEVSLEACFPHHAGHGFGLTIYEAPFFIKEEDTSLQVGMIVAIEPGLYLANEFGIRIEDNYLITENGYERLGKIPLDIENFIINA
jgi:Xaa-Pro aminopeptidase